MNQDNFAIYSALRSIKRHLNNRNLGLMRDELDTLDLELEATIQPVKGLGWFDQEVKR